MPPLIIPKVNFEDIEKLFDLHLLQSVIIYLIRLLDSDKSGINIKLINHVGQSNAAKKQYGLTLNLQKLIIWDRHISLS